MFDEIVVVRSGGDIATGVIQKLHRSGFRVLVLDVEKPTSIRRKVCLSEAIYENEVVVENVMSRKVNNLEEIKKAWEEKVVPVVVDMEGTYINIVKPTILVDAILAKKNLGTKISMAPLTIGLGPGFYASKDVHIVIETMRGHDLGKIIYEGYALEDTGIPGEIKGFTRERVLYSEATGVIKNLKEIGDIVNDGDIVATVQGVPIRTKLSGVLRGIIRNGSMVQKGLKIGDVDPRISERENCVTISDKARCIGGSVLECVLNFTYKAHENK